jgi:hypothetical protein
VPWIAITSGSSGMMTGVITYSVPANSGDVRRGTLSAHAAGRTSSVTVIQSGMSN